MHRWILLCGGIFIFTASLCFGQSWTAQTSGTTETLRHVQFLNTQVGFAVGTNGIFLKTTNGGSTWTHSVIQSGTLFIGCYFVNPDTGWAGGDRGVFKTTNGGSSWTQLLGPDGITKVYFVNAQLGWAVGGCDGCSTQYGEIYKTTDGGSTWTKQHNESTWSRFYGVQFVNATTGWAYTESKGVLIKTTDAGGTWQVQLSYGSSPAIRGMAFRDGNNGLVFGYTSTSGMVLKTQNGGAQFTDLSNNLQYRVADASFIDASTGWVVAGTRTGVGSLRTTDGGTTWTYTFAGAYEMNSISFVDASHGWMVGGNGTILTYTSATAVDDMPAAMPHAFALSQNYPNPFNPATTISYILPRESRVRVTVFNTLGQLVATLVDGVQPAGQKSVEWNAVSRSSGLYLYRLDAVEVANPTLRYSDIRTMLLVK